MPVGAPVLYTKEASSKLSVGGVDRPAVDGGVSLGSKKYLVIGIYSLYF